MTLAQQQVTALLQEAVGALEGGDASKAKRTCNEILADQPNQVDALHFMGVVLKKSGELEAAAKSIRQALRIVPNQPQAHNNLGNILAGLGETDDALKSYAEAVRLDPFFADPWFNRGLLEVAKGRHYQAIKSHRKAVSINPRDPRFLNALGIAHEYVDQLDEAIEVYRQALQLNPDNHKVLHNLALALKLAERLDESIEIYDQALELAPEVPEIHYNRANAHYERAEVAEAIRGYEAAIDIQPDFVDAHETLNQYYWEAGETDKFAKSFEPAIKRAPLSPELRAEYGRSMELSGRNEEALEILDLALKDVGGAPCIHHRIGRVLCNLQFENEAIYHFEEAIKGQPDDKRSRIDYAQLLIKVGDYQQALEQMEFVEDNIDPDDQEMWAFKGMCWRLTGDERDAWLNDYDRYLVARMIDVPEGYDDLEHFISKLKKVLIDMHRTRQHPLEQTVKGGTQTPGRLLHKPIKEIQDLKWAIEQNIRLYIDALPDDPLHPLCRRKREGFRFTGSWSVRLRSKGFHINHTHPAGWISGPTYIEVPDVVRADDPDHEGWVYFGESGLYLEPPRDKVHVWVPPVVGLNAIFPSYMWHGTVPFKSEQRRMTTPMDAHPV